MKTPHGEKRGVMVCVEGETEEDVIADCGVYHPGDLEETEEREERRERRKKRREGGKEREREDRREDRKKKKKKKKKTFTTYTTIPFVDPFPIKHNISPKREEKREESPSPNTPHSPHKNTPRRRKYSDFGEQDEQWFGEWWW
jgi:hypothetical protein